MPPSIPAPKVGADAFPLPDDAVKRCPTESPPFQTMGLFCQTGLQAYFQMLHDSFLAIMFLFQPHPRLHGNTFYHPVQPGISRSIRVEIV